MKISSINSNNILDEYIIIWLDIDINHANENIKNSFNNIRNIVNSIEIFININECIHFIENIQNKKIFMIINNLFQQEQQYIRLINLIDEKKQINSVYILSSDSSQEIFWKNDCKKLKGIFTQIKDISNALEQIILSFKNDCSITSIISTIDDDNNYFDGIDQLYIYSKILIEILFRIEYDDKLKKESFNFCREYYADNYVKLNKINEFEDNYQYHSPIWWYTKETPINSILQEALITQNFDIMFKMGFFIQDLHQAIKEIYLKTNQSNNLIVYRGQGMLNIDFEKFLENQDGLYAFHNFISTSTNEEIAFHYAECAKLDPKSIGIIFQMEINSSICTIPYAFLDNISYYLTAENEVLFSTHMIFKINSIKKIDERLWKVNLILTNNINQHLKYLDEYLRNEMQSINNWYCLALFWYKIGYYNKSIEIFQKLIETSNENNQENFMKQLAFSEMNIGLMNHLMENYSFAMSSYEKALEIYEKSLPKNDPSLAIIYNNIGIVYQSIGNYSRALSYCEKSLDIKIKSLSNQSSSFIKIYSNIGMIYELKGDYLIALSYYEKSYEIQKSIFSFKHPSLILSYNNFAGIYCLLGKYSDALLYYKKTLDIQNKFLPLNHPSLAITCNNIGYVYQLMENYSNSLLYYEESLEIQKKISFSNQLSLATTYNNIGLVYRMIGNYSKALSYYEKTLKIEEKFLKSDHPSLASTYNNFATLYQAMENYENALIFYEKAYKIWHITLSPNHPSLTMLHNNIGSLYDLMGDYKNALIYYNETIEILETLPSVNQLELASTYNNIGEVYRSMKDYSKALLYYKKTLEIEEKFLTIKNPSLAITLNNMAVAFDDNNQYIEAFNYAQKALDIFFDSLGSNNQQTINTRKFLDQLRQKLSKIT